MYIGIPQILILGLMIMSFIFTLVKHGEPRKNYNAGETFIGLTIEFIILYCGGFFK